MWVCRESNFQQQTPQFTKVINKLKDKKNTLQSIVFCNSLLKSLFFLFVFLTCPLPY